MKPRSIQFVIRVDLDFSEQNPQKIIDCQIDRPSCTLLIEICKLQLYETKMPIDIRYCLIYPKRSDERPV